MSHRAFVVTLLFLSGNFFASGSWAQSVTADMAVVPALRSGEATQLGVALTNPTRTAATVILTARDYDGQVISGDAIRNPAELTIGAQSQLARRSTEIFGAGIAGRDGWIEVETSAGVDGFFQLYDDRLRTIDGGALVRQKSSSLVFDEVDGNAMLHVVNAGAVPLERAHLYVYGNDGRLVGDREIRIAANAGWSGRLGELIPEAQTVEGWAILYSDNQLIGVPAQSLAGMIRYRGPGDDAIVMGRSEGMRMRTGYVPHVAIGGSYNSRVKLINTQTVEQRVRLSLGVLPRDLAVDRVLSPHGRLDEDLQQMFGLTGGDLATAYLKVETLSDTPGVNGFVEISSNQGQQLTSIALSAAPQTEFVFSHVAEGAGYYTGLALFNPEQAAATVTVEVYSPAGILVGSTVFDLGGRQRKTNLLRELFPAVRQQLGGYVRVIAVPAIYGLQLLGTATEVLANIPSAGGRLDIQGSGTVISSGIGAVVVTEDGRVTLVVPPGALPNPSIELRSPNLEILPPAPTGRQVLGAVEALPNGTQFDRRARLTFVLSHAAIPGSRLPLMLLNPQTNTYETTEFIATIDDNGIVASVDVTHFTTYALLGAFPPQNWTLDTARGAPGSTVRISGAGLAAILLATFQGPGQTSIPAEIVSRSAAELVVRVPEGAVSGALVLLTADVPQSFAFEVIATANPKPVLDQVSPQAIRVGDPAGSLTITGLGFVAGAWVTLDGIRLQTIRLNATMLAAEVPSTLPLAAGFHPLQVFNPEPGGGGSGTVDFEVRRLRPQALSVVPAQAIFDVPTIVTIVGQNFTTETTVTFIGNGSVQSVQFIDAQTIAVEVRALNSGALRLTAPAPVEFPGFSDIEITVVNSTTPPVDPPAPAPPQPVNTAPTAVAQSVSTDMDTAKAITLAGSDTETALASLSFTVTVSPIHGTLTGTAPTLSYAPSAGYAGADSFEFTVTDRGKPENCGGASSLCSAALTSSAAVVSIAVAAVNSAPAANPQTVSTNEDTAKAITLSASDTETATANLTFTVTSGPNHGTLTGTAPNLTYTPTTGYFGADSFQFTATDRGNPDNCGVAGLACAAAMDSTAATVGIVVVPVNTAPTAVAQSVSTDMDTAKAITLAGTDTETAPASLSFTVTVSPIHGALTGIAPNLSYAPTAGYAGADSFEFTVTDRGKPDNCSGAPSSTCSSPLTSSAATVSITVVAVNTAPAANPQSVSTNESTAKAITLSASDTETLAANLTFTVTAGPSHGVLSGAAPNLIYTPTGGYFGADSFQFMATDRGNPDNCGVPSSACAAPLSSPAVTIDITVIPVNTAPTATAQSVSTNMDTAKAITVAGTDTETAPASLSFTVTVSPIHGTLTGAAANLSYAPTAGYAGADSFEFTVTDRGKPDNCSGAPSGTCSSPLTSSAATVSITVVAVNTAPAANPQSLSTNESTAKAITLSASDAETLAANLTFSVTTGPSHGMLSGAAPNLTYTPTGGYFGADSFQFTATDRGNPDNCGAPGSACAAALNSPAVTIDITVIPVNTAPAATAQSVSTNMDTAKAITLAGTDTETAPASLSFTVTVSPIHGTLTGTAPNLSYAPTAGYAGADSFEFTVTDRGKPDNCSGAPSSTCSSPLTSSAATVSITVVAVNTAPAANPQSLSTNESTAKAITLSASDTETLAANLTFTVTAGPSHGALSGAAPNLTYTPTTGYSGTDSFQFTATDRGNPDNCGAPGSACAAALASPAGTIDITVIPVNAAPTATAQSVSTNMDTAKAITLAGSDTETAPASLSFTVTVNPIHGMLTGTAPNLNYAPTAGYAGADSFEFTVTDRGKPDNCSGAPSSTCSSTLTSSAATVSITVVAVNTAPAADPQSVSTSENTATGITLSASDTETAAANLTFTVTAGPSHGMLTGAAPDLTYTPTTGYFGADSFQFTATDRGNPDNCGAPGSACAAALESPAAAVGITVTPVNTAPTANAQSVSTNEDIAKVITLTGSDVETASPANLIYTITANPSHGTLGTVSGQSVTYTPASNYNGSDSFDFKVTDRGRPDNCGAPVPACSATLQSSVVSVSITVDAVNDPPVAQPHSYNAQANMMISIPAAGLLVGAADPGDPENTPPAFSVGTVSATAPLGGSVSLNAATGAFDFDPPPGVTGGATFTYTICEVPTPAVCSAAATVTFSIAGPVIWFVNNSVVTSGDGRLSNPFKTLAEANAVDAANQNIFLYSGTYSTGLTLNAVEGLIGQGVTGSSFDAVFSVAPPAGTTARPSINGVRPTVQGTVTLASSSTVLGLNLITATATGLGGGSVTGVIVSDVSITTTTGRAVILNGTAGALSLTSVSSTGAANGISLTNTTGSFTVTGDGASDPANTTRGRTTVKQGGGTITLGSGGTITGSTGAGISLSSAANVTLRNMIIQNGGGSNVNNGADGLTVTTNSSNLILDNVRITGNQGNYGIHGAALAGLSMQHCEVDNNATLSGTDAPDIWNVRFDSLSGAASVLNSLFHHSLENIFAVKNAGTTVLGMTVTNSEFRDTAQTNPGNDGLHVEAINTANVSVNVSNSTFLRNRSGGFLYSGNDSSGGGTITLTNNSFEQTQGTELNIAHSGLGKTVHVSVHDNLIRQQLFSAGPNSGPAVSIVVGGGSNGGTLVEGTFAGNIVGSSANANSASLDGAAVVFQAGGAGSITALIDDNVVRQVKQDDALFIISTGHVSPGSINVTISNNDLRTGSDSVQNATSLAGLDLSAGADVADSGVICANVLANNIAFVGGSTFNGAYIATGAGNPAINLQGYGGAPDNVGQLETFIAGRATTVSPAPWAFPGAGHIQASLSGCAMPTTN